MKKHQDSFDEMFRFVGIFIALCLAVVIVGVLIYGVLGYLDDKPGNPHRVLATLLVFGIAGAYVLGRREGNAHRSGLEHGVDLKVSTAQRAPVRPTVAPASTAAQYNALLPDVQRATIVTRRDNGSTPVEM